MHGRWYDDACGTAFALELIGERWSLLIVRELMFGGRRFSDLRRTLPGISARVLTERLAGLENAGIVLRRETEVPVVVQLYELTPWGLAADEAIMALGRWAAKSVRHDPTLPLSAASLMLSFRTMFIAGRAEELALAATMRVGVDRFALTIAGDTLAIARGEADDADFALTVPVAMPIAALVYGKVPLDTVEAMGLTVTGDRDMVARFADCFALPAKIG